jgi:hypothetical protein
MAFIAHFISSPVNETTSIPQYALFRIDAVAAQAPLAGYSACASGSLLATASPAISECWLLVLVLVVLGRDAPNNI